MSEQAQYLKRSEIARHWSVCRAYVTKLGKSPTQGGKAMPEFSTLEEADAWRAVHAPPNPGRLFAAEQRVSMKRAVDDAKKIAELQSTTGPLSQPKATSSTATAATPATIDVQQFIARNQPFDALMITQAEEAPQVAHGLLKLAYGKGEPAAISAAIRNWHEASDAAGDVRERFLELQEKTGVLISLDDVQDVIGTELQAMRSALLKVGERIALSFSPNDPAPLRRCVELEVDAIIQQIDGAANLCRKELAGG